MREAELSAPGTKSYDMVDDSAARSLSSALHAVDELVCLCRPDGTLLDWNDRVSTVTDRSDEELSESQLSDLFVDPDQQSVSDAITKAATQQTSVRVRAALPGPGDEEQPYEVSLSGTDDGDQVVGIGRRITDTPGRQTDHFSMPVVEIWDGIVLSPIVGKLGSRQAERFTETLLEEIVDHEATIALIDITGVQSVDTQTAQHLIDTIQAVDLLGAEVIITGINPDLARTLVKLGIGFDVETRSSLIDGLQTALEMRGVSIQ